MFNRLGKCDSPMSGKRGGREYWQRVVMSSRPANPSADLCLTCIKISFLKVVYMALPFPYGNRAPSILHVGLSQHHPYLNAFVFAF